MKVGTSLFTKYDLTREEQRQAYIFSEVQLAMLQNERALAAEQKVSLTFDPKNPEEFMQREAELQARILFIDWLFEQHDICSNEHMQQAQIDAQLQS